MKKKADSLHNMQLRYESPSRNKVTTVQKPPETTHGNKIQLSL